MTYQRRLQDATAAADTLWTRTFDSAAVAAGLRRSRIKSADIRRIVYPMNLVEEKVIAKHLWQSGWRKDETRSSLVRAGIRREDARRIVNEVAQ